MEFGAETPMPGREKEYEEIMAQGGAQAFGGGNAPRPPIDEDRRNRSPGLVNTFYETSTADFKRPYGSSASSATTARWDSGGTKAPAFDALCA